MRFFDRLWPVVAVAGALLVVLAGCKEEAGQAEPDPELALDRPVEVTDVTVGEGEGIGKDYIVNVEYIGTFPGSEVAFDRNDRTDETGAKVNPPLSLQVGAGDVITGMEEGIMGMKRGGVREMVIPWQKAYGIDGRPEGNIGPKQDLKFRVTVLDFIKPGEESVYDFEDVKVGSGREVKEGDKVKCHYKCTYLNGLEFDDSRKRGDKAGGGTPLEFRVGATQVIKGMDAGVRGMKVGGVRKIWIPPALSFGRSGYGPIQGNQIIWVEVELLSIG
ncbi:MAG: FKBP-type peptidyl-prolyl cis-trans isomerase [Fimbriimonadaceae bacterium]